MWLGPRMKRIEYWRCKRHARGSSLQTRTSLGTNPEEKIHATPPVVKQGFDLSQFSLQLLELPH